MATTFEQQSAVRILIVEDNDAQRQILSDLIRDEGFEPVACSNADEALKQADLGTFGVAILDQRLPEMSGTELLEHLCTVQRGLQAIIHTAYGSFESARDAVNLGAFAYVEKLGHPEELMRQVHRAAQVWMTEALQRSEAKYRQLVDSVQAIVWRSDPATGRFRFVSQEAESMLGYSVRQWLTKPTFWQEHIHPEDRDWVLERCARATAERQSQEFEYRMIAADGRIVWLRDFVNIIIEAGQPSELVGVMIDITEQNRIAEALRRSEDRLKKAQHIAHIGNWELDLEHDTLVWSDEMFRIHGLDPFDFEGDVQAFISTTVHQGDQMEVQAVLQEALRDCSSFTSDYRILQPGGRERIVSAQGHVLCEDGRPVRMVGVVQDITERKRAEEALRNSEQSFRLMFSHNPLPMWVYDRETHAFLDVNNAAQKKYGYDRDAFLSMKIEDIRPAEDIPRFREYIAALSGAVQNVTQWKHQKRDGTVLDVEVTAHDFPYRERPARLVLANDITERNRLEKEILEISNREQRRIGQDLHDGLGQLLTGIGFRIAELEGDLEKTALAEAADAAELGQMVERAIAQTRALAHGLDPVNVEQQGLSVALRELTQSIESIYGVACEFACPDPVAVHDPEVAMHVYRIAQESINNALKHAQASRVDVMLGREDTQVVLSVRDDGLGLTTTNPRREGMGLRIMDYRARMIGGTFEVGAGPAGGTVVTCRFPHTLVQQPAQ